MVEYQVGCSDISQSKEAKVKARTKSTRPAGEYLRMVTERSASPLSSWRSESERRNQAKAEKIPR